jgi:branched-chain amino acid aminotransferase
MKTLTSFKSENYLISLNGTIMTAENAMVSVMDRGFLFGDSVYDVFYCQQKNPVFFYEHLERLYQSAERIGLPFNFDKSVLIGHIKNLVSQNPFEESFVRMVVTRGIWEMGLGPQADENVQNTIVLYLKKFEIEQSWMTKGVNFKISSYERNSKRALDPMNKTGNYLNGQLALHEAKKQNYHDAIMLNAQGEITEGTTNNFWLVRNDGTIVTPDLKSGLLKGITRDKVFSIATSLGFKFEERVLYPSDIATAAESFYTSATKGIVPITQIDAQMIGNGLPGPITKQLIEGYNQLISKYIKAFEWPK